MPRRRQIHRRCVRRVKLRKRGGMLRASALAFVDERPTAEVHISARSFSSLFSTHSGLSISAQSEVRCFKGLKQFF